MPAAKKINIQKVAEVAGVSPSTVSRALNHKNTVKRETLKNIEDAIDSLGYVSTMYTRSKSPSSKRTIIVNCPLRDQFYLEITKGVETAASANGYFLLSSWNIINAENLHEFLDMLKKVDAAGVIMLNPLPKKILEEIDNVVPLIQCCEFNPESDISYVTIDDFSAAKEAVNYLISVGRKRVGFVSGGIGFKYALDRQNGYRSAMKNANLPIAKHWEIQLPENSYSLAYSSVLQMLQYNDNIPDAFFTTSDFLAMAVIKAARQYNKDVPRDIMVIGFDNIEFSSMTSPALSTVKQPSEQIGYTACTMLIQRLTTPGIMPKSMVLDTELILRESSINTSFTY